MARIIQFPLRPAFITDARPYDSPLQNMLRSAAPTIEKSACAALGLARNTISQDSGKADSYFRASTRKTTLDGITRHSVADSLGNGQTDTSAPHRRRIVDNGIVVHQIMHDDVFSRYPTTAFEHRDEIAMAFQPFHRSMPLNQAARDLRPLARRRLIRARPARVRMR